MRNKLFPASQLFFQLFANPTEKDYGPFQWDLQGHELHKLIQFVNGPSGSVVFRVQFLSSHGP